MNDIEVGEYVRTKGQGIKQIDFIFENKTVNKYGYKCGSDWDGIWYSYIKTTDIISHSKNIIDLIEVGDYVNDYKVLEVCPERGWIEVDCNKPSAETTIWENETESIVTKEQFEKEKFIVNK